MNLIEYLTPILRVKKKLDAIQVHFRETLLNYLPADEIPLPSEHNEEDENQFEALGDKMESMAFKVNIGPEAEVPDLSLRRYQAVKSFNLMDEKPVMLDAYMELVVQYGYIVLFSAVFPLASLLSLISNGI